MNIRKEIILLENSDNNQSEVIPIRKNLDVPVIEEEDWLTPLAPGTEFVSTYKNYSNHTFLDFYRKICNYKHCVFLIEENHGQELARYVVASSFCKQNKLIEVLYNNE